MKYVKTHSQVKAAEKGIFGESNAAAINKAKKPAEWAVNATSPRGAAPAIPGGWPKGAKVKHTRHQK